MAHLAFVGCIASMACRPCTPSSCARPFFRDLARLSPTRIVNKTNGITFRRWLYQANQRLTGLLIATLGDRDTGRSRSPARRSSESAEDASFAGRFRHARLDNKIGWRPRCTTTTGVALDPHALFDVHVKRIHEYKRQLLNLLETVALYQAIRARAGCGSCAASQDLRRQGRRQLSARQADHQACAMTSRKW